MKRTSAKLDIIGNGGCSSDREIFTAILKNWRQKLGYCSIFATIPAMVLSNVQAARTEETSPAKANAPGPGARVRERLNLGRSNRALLKRQSKFRLPHQMGSSDGLAPLAGSDDCPGRTIPGGNYTAAAPYVDSSDTTGANNTVGSLEAIYYYSFGNYHASGPDHVYSFMIAGLGPNPKIEVSTTSGSYRPLIYVLLGGPVGPCPAGTGNLAGNWLALNDSRGTNSNTATIQMRNFLQFNVPLHLFIDSAENDAKGAGPYTIRMQDVTIAPAVACANPIDCPDFFVRQHYFDFLNRQPDAPGLDFWTNEMALCGANASCIEAKRINVSAAYFLSIEFQQTGYLVYRFYKASYGNALGAPVPLRLNEFLPDTQRIGQGVIVKQPGWEQVLESNKQAFATEFVQRSRFVSTYSTSMSSQQFVDALFLNAGVTPSAIDRAAAINEFAFGATTNDVAARSRALRRVAENSTLQQQEFNRAFVLMQYFGYLRRNPNDWPEPTLDFQGYNFWLAKLNQFNSDYIDAEMVKAFIISDEYRRRFGP